MNKKRHNRLQGTSKSEKGHKVWYCRCHNMIHFGVLIVTGLEEFKKLVSKTPRLLVTDNFYVKINK